MSSRSRSRMTIRAAESNSVITGVSGATTTSGCVRATGGGITRLDEPPPPPPASGSVQVPDGVTVIVTVPPRRPSRDSPPEQY